MSALYDALCDLAKARDERNAAVVEAGTASEEEQALARMFGGDTDDGLVLDARERGARAGGAA